MTYGGIKWGGAQQPEWSSLFPAGRETTPEILHIWLFRRDGTLAATLCERGHGRHVTLPLSIIARALVSTDAGYLFMAHNHPSGDARPSHADIDATRQIWRLARTLGASLQDHLVIGQRRAFSFRDSGLL
jgi:DNA repair protein RadC